MDYTESALPKVSKHVQTKAMRNALRRRIDRLESDKVRKRSGGQCEVLVITDDCWRVRCENPATQVHHLIGGHGKRARGPSLLAVHKQHVCAGCHQWITGDIGGKKLWLLMPAGQKYPEFDNPYMRPQK